MMMPTMCFSPARLSKGRPRLCHNRSSDGEKAICYLSGSDGFSDRVRFPIPSLLFLDLKMPKVSGFEVLEWLQKHHGLGTIKVVVLSSSNLPSDMQKARALGAHDYRVKPADIDDMITMVKDIADRWLTG